jgi:hypothetical protein
MTEQVTPDRNEPVIQSVENEPDILGFEEARRQRASIRLFERMGHPDRQAPRGG